MRPDGFYRDERDVRHDGVNKKPPTITRATLTNGTKETSLTIFSATATILRYLCGVSANEVLEQWTHAKPIHSIFAGKPMLNLKLTNGACRVDGEEMSVNALLTKKLADKVKGLILPVPVTTGNNETNPPITSSDREHST
jgi:hypothetical protein